MPLSAAPNTVLITGASGGIGLELSRLFAQDGFALVLVARSGDRLSNLARELAAAHKIQAEPIALDLSLPEAPEVLFAEVARRKITVDILVNNAGFGDSAPFAAGDWEIQRQMLQVNILAVTRLTRLFLPGMVERNQGRILNLGSTASFTPVPGMAVYGATKAFVLSFSEALAAELQGTGVTVTALCPGVTETNFAARAKIGSTLLVRLNSMPAARVARIGHAALMRGRPRTVAGWLNRGMIAALRFASRGAALRIIKKLMRP